MTEIDTKNLMGNQLTWKGEFDLGKSFISEIVFTNRTHKFSLPLNTTKVQISLTALVNTKEIVLISEKKIKYCELGGLLFDLLRYENLFEGIFFHTQQLYFDSLDLTPTISKEWFSYYSSTISYTYINFSYDSDTEYKNLFLKWKCIDHDFHIAHQMFLYSCFSTELPFDIKLALLLQTFEPVSDILYRKGNIILTKPLHITKSITCNNCQEKTIVNIPNKELHFFDKLQAIVNQYGGEIFGCDNTALLIDKSVNLRNKVVHLDASNPNILSAEESGAYIYKFSLLYRIIIWRELGLSPSKYNTVIEAWIRSFNKRYPCSIIQ